jgi:MOSC domain-containing protein
VKVLPLRSLGVVHGDAVGSVKRLWRFPVKSMLGEEIESAEVVWSGFHGNRCYALVDSQNSKLVSAKNPLKWGGAFSCNSRLVGAEGLPSGGRRRQPAVRVTLPDGRHYDIMEGNYGGAEAALSELLGRQVTFVAARSEPQVLEYEQYHPEIDEDPLGGTTTEFVRPVSSQAGTFTDKAAIHLLTESTLIALTELYPDGNFDPLRFRPNVLIDTHGAKGFVERDWVGSKAAIGEEVEIEIFAECGRCVMTTLPQSELTSDNGILSTVMKYNRGKAGVFASVLKGGKVKKGDEIILL